MCADSTRLSACGFHSNALRAIGWIRYVDDILCRSYQYCTSCQMDLLRATFKEPLSCVHRTDVQSGMFDWVD